MNKTLSKSLIIKKTAGGISLLLLFIFSTLYFLLTRFHISLVFHIGNYHNIVQVVEYFLLAGYVFILIALVLLSVQKAKLRLVSAGMFMFITMLGCLGTGTTVDPQTVLDKVVLDNETYYLTGEIEPFDVHTYHRLYKCSNTDNQCEVTPFWGGGGASFKPLLLLVDQAGNKDEISVIYTFDDDSAVLIYTLGSPNRYYEEPAQLGGQLYYLAYAESSKSQSRRYMLFQCQGDNTGCIRLPFEYEGFARFTEVQTDETTNEIKIFFQDDLDISTMKYGKETLIYSYDGQPHCYVEGCEILEK